MLKRKSIAPLFCISIFIFLAFAPMAMQASSGAAAPPVSAVTEATGPAETPLNAEKKETAATPGKAEQEALAPAAPANPFKGTFWALIPPLAAILLALLTKEVYSSLFAGVLLGGLFASNFSFIKTMDCVISTGLLDAIKATAGVFVFLVILGTLVAMIGKSGAAASFGKWAEKNVKSRIGTMLATSVLGILIFVDDYFNCLTVGSVMAPATDAQRISRAKLAYIIDATAAPVCMIAPISSWAAAVSQYASGTPYSGLELFIRAIPYNFYSLLSLFFLFMIAIFNVDFGPMRRHEMNARETGDLFTDAPPEAELDLKGASSGRGMILDIVIPLILLTFFCVYALVHVGGYPLDKGFIDALGNTDAMVGLPWGAVAAFILCVLYFSLRKIVTVKESILLLPQGFSLMVPAIIILTLATSLKNMTDLLGAKDFVAAIMNSCGGDLAALLPALVFLAAAFLAFSTGTAWGTFGILIPIVVALFPASNPLLYISISACLAGSVCGDHSSPISDTTIMASAGARCNHITHVVTQLPYVIVVASISLVGFVLAGISRNWTISFLTCILLVLGFLLVVKMLQKREKSPHTAEK